MMDDEPLDRRSIVLVDSLDNAEKLIKVGAFDWYGYEKIDTLSNDDVNVMVADRIHSKLPEGETKEECRSCEMLDCFNCDIGKEVILRSCF